MASKNETENEAKLNTDPEKIDNDEINLSKQKLDIFSNQYKKIKYPESL